MLTTAAVEAARPRAAAYKLTDAAGLHLFVAPAGPCSWRWRFRWKGREQLLTIGSWPDFSFDQRGSGATPLAIGAISAKILAPQRTPPIRPESVLQSIMPAPDTRT